MTKTKHLLLGLLLVVGLAPAGFAIYGPTARQIQYNTNSLARFAASGTTNVQDWIGWLNSNILVTADGPATTNWAEGRFANISNDNTFATGTSQSMYRVGVRDTLAVSNNVTLDGRSTWVFTNNAPMMSFWGTMTNGQTNVTFPVSFTTTTGVVVMPFWDSMPPAAAGTNMFINFGVLSSNGFTFTTSMPVGTGATNMRYWATGPMP